MEGILSRNNSLWLLKSISICVVYKSYYSSSVWPPPPTLPSCRLPPEERRGYKNVFDALFRITKEEGIGTLWRVSKTVNLMTVALHNTYCVSDGVNMSLISYHINLFSFSFPPAGMFSHGSKSHGGERSTAGYLLSGQAIPTLNRYKSV